MKIKYLYKLKIRPNYLKIDHTSYAARVLRAAFRLADLGYIFILTINFYREEKNNLESLIKLCFLVNGGQKCLSFL